MSWMACGSINIEILSIAYKGVAVTGKENQNHRVSLYDFLLLRVNLQLPQNFKSLFTHHPKTQKQEAKRLEGTFNIV